MKLAELEPGELDIELEGKVARDYMTYLEEVREIDSDKDMQELVCQESHVGPGTTIRIKDNFFGMTRGDNDNFKPNISCTPSSSCCTPCTVYTSVPGDNDHNV